MAGSTTMRAGKQSVAADLCASSKTTGWRSCAVARSGIGLEEDGADDGAAMATDPHPAPVAGPTVRRQLPAVRAVCANAHVRIRAGGAGQPVSLP